MLKLTNNSFSTLKSKPAVSDNQSTGYLLQGAYIRQEIAGAFHYLPLGLRVLNNIKEIIRRNLESMGAQEIMMTSLGAKDKWEKTGRENIDILFKVPSSDGKYNFLNPTHEEMVTPLVKEFVRSYKDLPVKVFQTQTKFRNEKRAKSGLLRGREFLMNDMYSFHRDQTDLDNYYEESISIYKKIFAELGIGKDTYLTYASGGSFSKYSHEFQVLLDVGEDTIYVDREKGVAVNKEIIDMEDIKRDFKDHDFVPQRASEVGNIFKLGTKFSEAFNLAFDDEEGKKHLVKMGCYGIGVSRAMGIIAEKFCDEKGLVWPEGVAPYDYYVISIGNELDSEAHDIIQKLENSGKQVIFDDRNVGFGQKAGDADLMGIPNRVVLSSKSKNQGGIEFKKRNENQSRIITDIDDVLGK